MRARADLTLGTLHDPNTPAPMMDVLITILLADEMIE
jgi:hypothetical protein